MTRVPPRLAAALCTAALLASGPIHAQVSPRLLDVDTSGSDTPYFGLPDGPVQAPVTALRLRFDAPAPALLLSAFRLVEAGADGVLDTMACGPLPTGDDVEIALWSVNDFDAAREILLDFDAPRGLPRGTYRVLACDALPGSASRDFSVEETPALDNPTFSVARGVDAWRVDSPTGDALIHHTLDRDADQARGSGALRLASGLDTFATLSQPACIELAPLAGTQDSAWRLRLRHRVAVGNVRITATFWHGFSGDLGEPDCRGPGIEDTVVFDAQPTVGLDTFDSGWRPLDAPLPLGHLRLSISSRDGQPFDIVFDDIGLRFDSRIIFRDSF